jgi:hypothetical protein
LIHDGRDGNDEHEVVIIEKTSGGWLFAACALLLALVAVLHYFGVLRLETLFR